jgi:hypothetical protein
LEESGYYVLPVVLVAETFHNNGLTNANDIQETSSDEGGNNSGGGLIGMLITAAVKQIIAASTDAGHPIAGIASNRLLSAGHPAGLLYGPRSPKYGTD